MTEPSPASAIRPAGSGDALAIARVQVVTWQQAYRGILPARFLDAMDAGRSAETWRTVLADRRRVTFVLEAPEVAAFCTAGPARGETDGYVGEIEALYVRPDLQGRGIGTALVRSAMAWLSDAALHPVVVWALEANRPAHGFYQGLGARRIDTRLLRIADALYPEVGFGWAAGALAR